MRVRTSRTTVSSRLYHQLVSPSSAKDECEAPITLTLEGLPDPTMVRLGIERDQKMFADQLVRCRKCPACLRARSTLWTARAIDETVIASRSWFGTLTLHPVQAAHLTMLADRTARRRRNERLSDMSSADRFKAIADEARPALTKWLKRVRYQSGARLRYLLVCEAHKSGVPHWHILIHESDRKVLKRTLESEWQLGFSQFRLVDGTGNAARYVCKYLAKSALTKVRASLSYGKPPGAWISRRVSGSANDEESRPENIVFPKRGPHKQQRRASL